MSTTPNMLLQLPSPSVTLGPEWASELNTALGLVDSHNHAPGSGSLIGTAGIRIDGMLDFNTYDVVGLRTARLSDQTSISLSGTDLRAVYSKNGDLFYVNSAGAQVQITSGSSIVGTTGSISGLTSPASAVYSSLTSSFSFNKDSSKPGKLAISDISFYEFDNASAAPITIKSPAAVAAAYSLTLPSALYAPATTFLAVNSSGATSLGAGGTLLASDGGAGAPSMSFYLQANTGFYRSSPTEISVSLGGTATQIFKTTGMLSPGGNPPTPSYGFSNDQTTGIFSNGSGMLGVTNSGTTSAIFTTVGLRELDGTRVQPSYAFISDTDTGMYLAGANAITLTAGGTDIVRATSTGVSFSDGTTFMTPLVFTGICAAGGSSVPSVTTVYTGAYKAAFGSFVNSAGGRSIIGAFDPQGVQQANADVTFQGIASATSSVIINNHGTGTRAYTVIVFT